MAACELKALVLTDFETNDLSSADNTDYFEMQSSQNEYRKSSSQEGLFVERFSTKVMFYSRICEHNQTQTGCDEGPQ